MLSIENRLLALEKVLIKPVGPLVISIWGMEDAAGFAKVAALRESGVRVKAIIFRRLPDIAPVANAISGGS